MDQLPEHADIVVIGAGVVGNAAVAHLAEHGWQEIVQIDKGPLPDPGGSTGHASNFVFPVDHSKEITDLTVDSLRQYEELGVAIRCGGIEVARSPQRMQELTRRMTSAMAWGVEAELISPARIQELVPHCDASLLRGGFHTPTGSVVDPIRAGELWRERAAARGALTTVPDTEVTGIDVRGGEVRGVRTDRGEVRTERVLIACGVWSPLVAALAGARIPLTPAVHQMIDVGPVAALAGSDRWISFPLVRDMDELMYERQRGTSLEIGSYAHRPILHHPREIPDDPARAGQATATSFPFTEEDFTAQLAHARELFPSLLTDPEPPRIAAINGLLSLTPDGGALVGELPEVRGLWTAAAVWIKEAAAVGRMVAELLTDGTSEIDAHPSDVARFHPAQTTAEHVRARAREGFPKVYGISHPREQWSSDRPLRTSPLHDRTTARGAEFFETAGWERPQWYAANLPLLEEFGDLIPRRTHEWDARWWSPLIEAEHLALRDRAGLVDLAAFTIMDVTGPGALGFLEGLTVARMDVPVGRIVYTPMLTERGTFRSDLTVVRRGEESFRVITGGADGRRDLVHLRRHLPVPGSGAPPVQLVDATSAVSTIGVWGPLARELLQPLTSTDLSDEAFGFGTAQDAVVAGAPVSLLRISYVGDLGWELHVPTEFAPRLWDRLWGPGRELGAVPAGIGVYGTTGRLEKGYRLMGAELTGEVGPVEVDLALPRVKRAPFVGRERYLEAREAGAASITCTLALVEDQLPVGAARCPTGGEPVLDADGSPLVDERGRRSYVTSAGPGPSLGRYLMLAALPVERATTGASVLVQYLGARLPAEVLTVGRTSAFDPEDSRMKG